MSNKRNSFVEEEEELVYSRQNRAKLIDEDQLSNEEEGFMEGYDEDTLDEEEDKYCKLDIVEGKSKI